jgi:hypothetical protein
MGAVSRDVEAAQKVIDENLIDSLGFANAGEARRFLKAQEETEK